VGASVPEPHPIMLKTTTAERNRFTKRTSGYRSCRPTPTRQFTARAGTHLAMLSTWRYGMGEQILEHAVILVDTEGITYRASTWGERREDGTWWGWLEFEPRDGGALLATGQETSQPNRDALAYWATGLEPIYLEGALIRARDLSA
jgi:hypothetical protein